MSKFEVRKKLLAAESDVYRQMLKLEIQTFKEYGTRTKRRLASVRTYLPWVLSGLRILSGLSGPKRSGFSLKRLGPLFLVGWKAYRQFAPLFGRRKLRPDPREPTETAAEEYLAKRL